ncbi:hypothetical protein L1049_026177 [Liquidambar formosana]|uniref:Late embryogenesis abundant protein n=1 Tax=Liquidambar formosana TaxID=63359 RepID=A0AAP0R735_LIQFO
MHKPSHISLCKLLFGYPFQRSSKPSSLFQLKSFTPIPNQLVSGSAPSPEPKFLNLPSSKFHHISHPTRSTQFVTHEKLRKYSGDSVADFDQNKVVDEINLKFAEAREEIEMALESKETVYFDEEAECARAAVKEVLEMFDGLLGKLPESEKAALQRSMGLKIEQLKAELEQLNE